MQDLHQKKTNLAVVASNMEMINVMLHINKEKMKNIVVQYRYKVTVHSKQTILWSTFCE